MDYNIKFEYKGIGKQASSQRQKAIQAQKTAEKQQAQGASTPTNNRELINTLQKLIESNKRLESAISKGGASGGGGGHYGGGGHSSSGGSWFHQGRISSKLSGAATDAGFGRIGAAIPIVGAAIAALGFTIQKVNQVGHAYLDQTSKQMGTVGLGGFRYGQGTYAGEEISAGMASYAKSSGRFAQKGFYSNKGKDVSFNYTDRPNETALQLGNIYGLSAAETLGQAGTFKRAGADYEGAARGGMGAGIESELPLMMAGMAQILQEAIKSGLDTSEMSKNMAKNLTLFTSRTPGKSVEAALGLVKSFGGIQKQFGEGQINSLEGLMTYKSSENILMGRINDPKYLERMQKKGLLSTDDMEKISGKKGGIKSPNDLRGIVDPMIYQELVLNAGREADTTELTMGAMKQMQGTFGKGNKGMIRALNAAGGLKGLSREQFMLGWTATEQGKSAEQFKAEQKAGATSIESRSAAAAGSPAGWSSALTVSQQSTTFNVGQPFAIATVKMDNALREMAEGSMNLAVSGINKIKGGMSDLESLADGFSKKIKEIKDFSFGGMIESFFFGKK